MSARGVSAKGSVSRVVVFAISLPEGMHFYFLTCTTAPLWCIVSFTDGKLPDYTVHAWQSLSNHEILSLTLIIFTNIELILIFTDNF